MTPSRSPLEQFLRGAATVHRRATVRDAGLKIFSALGMTVVLAGTYAAVTLRGDLARMTGTAVSCGLLVLFVSRAIERHQRFASSPSRVARTLVGPLRDAGHPELARDLVAATEILAALREDEVKGSRALATTFLEQVQANLGAGWKPLARLLAPARHPRSRSLALGTVALVLVAAASPAWRTGFARALRGVDQSPLPAPSVVWRDLEFRLSYPPHTQRADKTLKNPTGPLKVPAGTRVDLKFVPNETHGYAWAEWIPRGVQESDFVDGTVTSTPLARDADGAWTGAWTVRGHGQWRVFLGQAPTPQRRHGARSAWMNMNVDADDIPEVELSARAQRDDETTNLGRVEIPFIVRDDFGLSSVELVYETGEGEVFRLPIRGLRDGQKRWRKRYTWDLSMIPLDRRGEVVWWIEARDNDPGLSLDGPLDPPGKVGRSSLQQLKIRDEEAEHLANLTSLRRLREASVDRLADRLVTTAFASGSETTPQARVAVVRAMLQATELLLAQMTILVERLALDTRVRPRDVETLGEIQARLFDQFTPQQEMLEGLSSRPADTASSDARRVMSKLRRQHAPTVSTFEDEIIRIDDLVDAEVLRRFERLLARLETSQRRLAELLAMLAAGDDSVLPEVELLRARIRRDTAALNEARSLLKREIGNEFMNTEALAGMLRRMEALTIDQKIAEGDYQGALQQAQETLESLRESGDSTRRRLGEQGSEESQLSEEEKARVRLLRTLSRLHDEQSRLEQQARALDAQWRSQAQDTASRRLQEKLRAQRGTAQRRLDKINDARLSRPGRVAYEDAEIALESLEMNLRGDTPGPLLPLLDQTRALVRASQIAMDGAGEEDPEYKALRRVARLAGEMTAAVRKELPSASDKLPEEDVAAIGKTTEGQIGLRERTRDVLDTPDAKVLPSEGADALRDAVQGMKQAREELKHPWLDDSAESMATSKDALQRAMDSLRNRQPPPPQSASSSDASTEGSRRAGLRKAVLDAMRTREDTGDDPRVSRFYEELLR
jgi:hypothetical protein